MITLRQQSYDCINNTKNNYKQLLIFINLAIKVCNGTHYSRIAEQISFERMDEERKEKH
jgi:hypothetical protein